MPRFSAIATPVLCLAAAANAQILNGSFEAGPAYPGGLNIFSPGTPPPWVASNLTPDCYDNTGADGWNLGGIPAYNNMFQAMPAAAGNRFIGFAASTTFAFNESFQQTTPPLNAGQTYTISAQLAADDIGRAAAFGGPYFGRGQVDVLLNGTYIGTLTQNTASFTWEARSFSFVAPLATTAVFRFVAQAGTNTAGIVDSSYIGIDDIRLVPSPGSLALLGLAGIVAGRRRR